MTKRSQRALRYGLIFFALLVLGVIGYQLYQVRKEKSDFAKAEANLDALATQIQQTIGKADEVKKEKTCGRANLKSEEGPLICSVSTSLLYKNKNSSAASSLMATISNANDKALRIGSGITKGSSFFPTSERKGAQTFYQDFPELTKPRCTYSFSYPATVKEFDMSGENFKIEMSCGGTALKEYYPLRD